MVLADWLPNATILKYYGYQATDSVGFIWPIFTLFLLWNDLTFAQIGLLSAISAVLVVCLEVPTGYVADRLGRRNALALGMVAMALSIIGFVVADAYWQFVVLYTLWAISIAFQSGTADAWLYDTLAADLRSGEFTRVRGRGGAVYEYASAITMIMGGLLYVVHPTYPFVASAILHACGIVIVYSMPQNAQYSGERRAGSADRTTGNSGDNDTPNTNHIHDTPPISIRESLSILRSTLLARPLRAFVVYVALFFAVVNATDTYIQPIAEDILGGVLESPIVAATGATLPEPALIGVLYACFAVVGAVASDNAARVRARFGLRAALIWLPVVVALALVVPAFLPLLAIPVFVLVKGVYALSKPLVNQYINDRATATGRATVLSATSMGYAFVRAPLQPLAGGVADIVGPLATVAGLGGVFLLGGLALLVVSRPVVVGEQVVTTE
ncbi:Major Facilitator Superfamily transporter [Natrialba chahannaoensis JCM 10990]|uniref:Major Facilitator Superfamily transporter n=1 Tax=Natrialba chahannaoensis JCM 10990 TaxID=1227492 RepID=M0B748_9EURY|nr:MFS transporter [Natrialba chahannaoensis]ELZ06347.1 Major Facilitator Superfamily transporter [Natrialba chahannaoensis JCM 10990]